MNCIKCPFAEECEVSKMSMLAEYLEGVSVPTKVSPYTAEECPLLQAVETAKSIRDEVKGG